MMDKRVVGTEMLMYVNSFIILISLILPDAESLVSSIIRRRYLILSEKYTILYLSMVYTLFLPLLSYVFSQAKQYNQELRAQIILLWMVLIEIIHAHSRNYSTWDLRKSGRQLVRIFWVGYLVYSYAALQGIRVSLFLLCIYSVVSEVLKVIMINKVRDSYLIGNNPKLIHNYVKKIMLLQDLRTTPMKICDYIIMGEETHDINVCSNGYCLGEKKSNSRGILTIGRVFQLNPPRDNEFNSEYPTWRDNCISLALAKMLGRRFAKVQVNEAGCRKALDFVLEGLLAYPVNRVFGIIQEELKFASDFLHLKIPTYYYFLRYVIIDLIGVAIIIGNGLYLLASSARLFVVGKKEYNYSFLHVYRYGPMEVDYLFFFVCDLTITVCLVFACSYTVCSWIRVFFTKKRWLDLIFVKFYVKDPAKWERYYSLWEFWSRKVFLILANCIKKVLPCKKTRVHSSILDVSILARLPKWIRTNIPRLSPTIIHSTDAKDAILRSLKNSGGRLTNGETSLKKYGMENLNWACQPNGSSTEAILVWHIATTLFHHQEPSPQQNNNPIKEQEVALVLSSYCHYLVESLPELLPDEVKCTENMYGSVIKEMMYGSVIKEILAIQWCWMPCRAQSAKKDRWNYAMHAMWVQSSIVGKGTMLAKDLMRCVNDGKQVWNMLAEFWAEMLLFIAPSDNVEGHEKVVDREEMITQLWALLTHAGIVTRPKDQDHENESNVVPGVMNV